MMIPDGAQHTPGLTPRQELILALIGEGMTSRLRRRSQAPSSTESVSGRFFQTRSDRQIGERLGVAEKTIKNSVTDLLACLNMERRPQAAVYAALRRVTAV